MVKGNEIRKGEQRKDTRKNRIKKKKQYKKNE